MKESKTEIAFLQSLNKDLRKEIKELKAEDEAQGRDINAFMKSIIQYDQEQEEVQDLLRRLEWGDDGSGFLVCPCCDRAKGGGHAQDCELDAAIRKGEGRL